MKKRLASSLQLLSYVPAGQPGQTDWSPASSIVKVALGPVRHRRTVAGLGPVQRERQRCLHVAHQENITKVANRYAAIESLGGGTTRNLGQLPLFLFLDCQKRRSSFLYVDYSSIQEASFPERTRSAQLQHRFRRIWKLAEYRTGPYSLLLVPNTNELVSKPYLIQS